MIRIFCDFTKWHTWEDEQIRNTPLDYKENFRIADAMSEQANAMGAMERQDPLEDIDFKIEFWNRIHRVR